MILRDIQFEKAGNGQQIAHYITRYKVAFKDCKTFIRRFDSDRRLHSFQSFTSKAKSAKSLGVGKSVGTFFKNGLFSTFAPLHFSGRFKTLSPSSLPHQGTAFHRITRHLRLSIGIEETPAIRILAYPQPIGDHAGKRPQEDAGEVLSEGHPAVTVNIHRHPVSREGKHPPGSHRRLYILIRLFAEEDRAFVLHLFELGRGELVFGDLSIHMAHGLGQDRNIGHFTQRETNAAKCPISIFNNQTSIEEPLRRAFEKISHGSLPGREIRLFGERFANKKPGYLVLVGKSSACRNGIDQIEDISGFIGEAVFRAITSHAYLIVLVCHPLRSPSCHACVAKMATIKCLCKLSYILIYNRISRYFELVRIFSREASECIQA